MKRNALFVGVDKYADGHIPDLSCAVRDATDLHGFFKYGAGYDRVELLPNPAGKKEVLSAVRELTAGLGRGDFFLFFFAGHGFRVGENHVLVCSEDLYDDVKYEEDGLPLGQLKRRVRGAFDSAILLDACQSDILATRGGEGLAARDLSLILEAPPSAAGEGALTVVASCDEGQTAGELAESGHGLFTLAMLDLLEEARRARSRLELSDSFRARLGRRMGEIAARSGLSTGQRPRFSNTGAGSFVLLDGAAPAVPPFPPSPPTASPTLVACPVCLANVRIEGTRNCAKCGRKYVCADCWDRELRCCSECSGKARREEAERKAREAEQRAREEEAKRKVEVERKEVERKAREEEDKRKVEAERKEAERMAYEKAERKTATQRACAEVERFSINREIFFGMPSIPQHLDKQEIFSWNLNAAKQGNADAQCSLGDMYYRGFGVSINQEEALKWYKMAAEQGLARAQHRLGHDYEYSRNIQEAARWYRKAAEQGDSDAQFALGRIYLERHAGSESEAVKWFCRAAENGPYNKDAYLRLARFYRNNKNYVEAAKWYRTAAEKGDENAQRELGRCGIPTTLDDFYTSSAVRPDEGAKWNKQLADAGNSDAQFSLGFRYEKGWGVPINYAEAIKWYRKASTSKQGYETTRNLATGFLKLLEQKKNHRPPVFKLGLGWACQDQSSRIFISSASWKTKGRNGTFNVGKIANQSSWDTGSLKLVLWFSSAPYNGGTLNGTQIGECIFSQEPLRAGYEFNNLEVSFPVQNDPPAGSYASVVTVNEFHESGSWYIVGWIDTGTVFWTH